MSAYVDVADLAVVEPYDTLNDYPTPDASESASADTEQPRKKRKAWGQPVPEIVPILPPRKRAKTAEEKEQRKNERILRNRRAADKSRQRQKAAVAELEQRQKDIETENTQLKRILAQYQSQFGTIPGCDFEPKIIPSTVAQSLSVSTPLSLNDTSSQYADDQSTSTPVLTMGTPPTSIYQESPRLNPTWSLGESSLYPNAVSVSGMTQYPAVSTGHADFEAAIHATESTTVRGLDLDPLSDHLADIFGDNALADDTGLPTFDGHSFGDIDPAGLPDSNQFSFDSYLDFDAGNNDATSGFPFETPEQTARLQS